MKPRVLMVVLPHLIQASADGVKIRSYLSFPYGVLSIATYCKDVGEFRVLDMNTHRNPMLELVHVLDVWKPDIVGVSCMFDNAYVHAREVFGLAKESGALTVMGGSTATHSYREILDEQPDLDAVCVGEGEIPMLELLDSGTFNHQAWVTAGFYQPRLSLEWDLDSLIDIDYSFINIDSYRMKEAFSPHTKLPVHGDGNAKQMFVMTSRGCPYSCRFCTNANIHGKKVRMASVEAIVAHVRKLVDRYGMEVLTIYDDQLLIDTDRAKQLFRELAQFGLRIECPNGLSVRFIDDELAGLMRKAGMDTVYLAIESGSQYVLDKLMHKPLKVEMVGPVVESLRRHGFFVHGFFVMGMPGETREHRLQTVQFIKDIDLDWAAFNLVVPLVGSDLYRECLENGWIEKQSIEDMAKELGGGQRYIIRMPGVNPDDVAREVYEYNLDVNFHNNRRMRIGDYRTAARCFEEVLRGYPGHELAAKYLLKCREEMNHDRNR